MDSILTISQKPAEKKGMRPRPVREITVPSTRELRVNVHERVGAAMASLGEPAAVFAKVRTLNTKGMSVRCDHRFPLETECRFRLMSEEGKPFATVVGWIVYHDDQGMAVQFDDLEPPTHNAIVDMVGQYMLRLS